MPPLRSSSAATIAEAVGRVDAAVVVGDAAAVERRLVALLGRASGSPRAARRCGRRRRARRRACRSCRRGRWRRSARAASRAVRRAAAPGLDGERRLQRSAERELAHRLGRIAAGLGPVGVRDRRRAGSSAAPAVAGIDRRRRPRWSAPAMRWPSTGVLGLALLEHAAAARGERRGDQQCNAKVLGSGHSWSYWAWVGARRWRRRRAIRRSGSARSRIGSGTSLSLAMAANSWPASLLLALLDQRQRGHLAGAAEPRLAGLGQRLQPGDHLLAAGAGRIRARSGGSARHRDRAAASRCRRRSTCRLAIASFVSFCWMRERGAGEQGRGAHRLAAALRQLVELLRRPWPCCRCRCPCRSARAARPAASERCTLVLLPPDEPAARGEEQDDARRSASCRIVLKKSRSWSRRRFSSTSRTKVSVMSGGCAKDVPQSARSGILLPVASLPHPG